jgi:hypothetical protein
MAQASEAALATDQIVFELERYEYSDGRLRLSGRWYGVRGRRFVRPTLTLDLQTGRVRALADLDDKPWPAEAGEPWIASFPWSGEGRVEASELSVAPDIAIQLPLPSSRRSRTQRLSAVPRREAMTASWGHLTGLVQAPTAAEAKAPTQAGARPEAEAEPGSLDADVSPEMPAPAPERPPPAPDPAALLAELEAARTELAEATQELARTHAELDATLEEAGETRAGLEAARRELGQHGDQSEAAEAELAAARAAREAALRSAAQAEAEREAALTRAAQAEEERDTVAAEKAELAKNVDQTRTALEQLTRERDQAMTSRGAALVMRGATRALPAYESHVGWLRRGLAVLVMLGVVIAALIVLHVL